MSDLIKDFNKCLNGFCNPTALVTVQVQYLEPNTMKCISRTFRDVTFGDSLVHILNRLSLFTYVTYNTSMRVFSMCVKNEVNYNNVQSFFSDFSKQLKFDF